MEVLSVQIFQANLANKTLLKTCMSRKPRPPSGLGWQALLQVTICVPLLDFLFLQKACWLEFNLLIVTYGSLKLCIWFIGITLETFLIITDRAASDMLLAFQFEKRRSIFSCRVANDTLLFRPTKKGSPNYCSSFMLISRTWQVYYLLQVVLVYDMQLSLHIAIPL